MNRIKWFDAVRVYAMFLVLGYHLFYNFLPGGFLGVTILFTFSGFLITNLILEEIRKKDEFDLLGFYKRRIKRILIPIFLMIIFTLPFMRLVSPDFSVGIDKQLASTLSFTANWFYIFSGTSYESRLLPSFYVHTWSLAAQMQFYFIWGLLCAVVFIFSKIIFMNNMVKRHTCFKTALLILSGAATIISFLYMRTSYYDDVNPDAIYFNTFTLFSFYLGAFAASIWGMRDSQDEFIKSHFLSKNTKEITVGTIIVALLAAGIIFFNFSQHKFGEEFMYRYVFLFTSLLTVVLIYCTHLLHILTPREMKEPFWLKATADMSYDIYLFNWPLYIVFSTLIMNNAVASLATLAVTIIFSAIMVYGAERILMPQGRDAFKFKHAAVVLWVFIAASSAVGCTVVKNAPPITSIEKDFAASYVTRDADGIVSLKESAAAINNAPVAYANGNAPLQANLLPKAASMVKLPRKPARFSPYQPDDSVEPPAGPPLEINGAVTVIGDSVSLGAGTILTKTIPNCYIDAVVSRPVSAGPGILADLQNSGKLGEYVVIALGTNGTYDYAKYLTQIIDALEPGHRLIFVTPFDGRSNKNSKAVNKTAEWIRELPNQYDFITIAEWHDLIKTHISLLAGDKVHMGGQKSMRLYTDCIAKAISRASPKPPQ